MSTSRKKRPMHQTSYESLVAWGCICGGRWMDEALKGKTDEQLIVERDESFRHHVRDMEDSGYA